jgi:spore coat polysaccharide biosynthesis protein SpsF
MTSCGKHMLEHIAERLRRVEIIDEIVFATTVNKTDDSIEELAEQIDVGCFRGSEEDVLSRVLGAAEEYEADIIVEITGDCPLIDPEITEQTILLYLENECDYASNDLKPSFPLGMNVEVFSKQLLQIADKEGKTAPDREHVSWFFVRNPDRFRLLTLEADNETYWPDLRLTLDEKEDYTVIDSVFRNFYETTPNFSLRDIISYLKKNPQIALINRHVVQKNPEDE